MVLLQKWAFLQLFFLSNLNKENVFYDILERKNIFLGYKKRSSKSRKIHIFLKELTQSLVQEWPFFQPFYSWAIKACKMSYMIF